MKYSQALKDATDIAGDYGEYLEHNPPAPGTVVDVIKLPHPKNKIKEALIVMLKDPSTFLIREDIKGSYILLSHFQEGVGNEPVGVDLRLLRNLNESNFDDRSIDAYTDVYKEYQNKWASIFDADFNGLMADIENL